MRCILLEIIINHITYHFDSDLGIFDPFLSCCEVDGSLKAIDNQSGKSLVRTQIQTQVHVLFSSLYALYLYQILLIALREEHVPVLTK